MVRGLKHSGRRAFLRGVGGTALFLPFLEFTHDRVWAAGDGSHRRFVTVFSHGGTISNQGKGKKHSGNGNNQGNDWWRPADPSSASLVLGPIHESLEPWRDKLLVVDGIDNKAAIAQDQYGQGAHGTSNCTALTAADTEVVQDNLRALGPSIDQVVAERLIARQPAPFERIHLSVSGHQYGSPYYRAAHERVGGESSPLQAFNSLFDGVTAEEPDPEVVLAQLKRASVIDGLMESYHDARGIVSSHDRHVIDAHLDHLRALEHELQNPAICTPPEGMEAGSASSGAAHGDVLGPLHVDIIVAALRCGLTNVANLEIADILTPWTPVGTPMNAAHGIGHSLHHYARDVGPTGPSADRIDDWLAEMLSNRQWRMSLMARLLEGLDDPTFLEGGQTLLDNSVVLYTSEFREGSGHIAWNVPVLLAGSAGGYFKTGRFVDYNVHAANDPYTLDYQSPESIHNLYTSILHAMGENDPHFGNDQAEHQGPLPGLT